MFATCLQLACMTPKQTCDPYPLSLSLCNKIVKTVQENENVLNSLACIARFEGLAAATAARVCKLSCAFGEEAAAAWCCLCSVAVSERLT